MAISCYCRSEQDGPTSLKVFVGGLDQGVREDEFRAHFEQFGTITDIVIMFDRLTQRSRGFGFVTYEDLSSVQVEKNYTAFNALTTSKYFLFVSVCLHLNLS